MIYKRYGVRMYIVMIDGMHNVLYSRHTTITRYTSRNEFHRNI